MLDGQWQGDEVVRSTEAPGRLVLRVLLWVGVLVVGPVLVVLVWLGSRTGFEPVPLPPTATSEGVLAARDAEAARQEAVLRDALSPVRTATGAEHLATGQEASCDDARGWPRGAGADVACRVRTVVVAGPRPVAGVGSEMTALHEALLAAGFEGATGRPTLVDVLAEQVPGADVALLEPAVYQHPDGAEVTVRWTHPADRPDALRWSLPGGCEVLGSELDGLVPPETYVVGLSTEDRLTF
ncbi:hypothetical protein [Cellulomonas cellasea]|uniref:Uncharacterized protein n=1 Tax=Cellulomonas cellasea TaxID=43670 RepID=A0A7W4UCW6_9CELL|nr:hypothetical protein [Cellulomonas cellasea]MBB2921350.1 hypothetical protein [Cellulomonas cellasea]